ncbi:MAG: PEP/pyruvate-binding domain-containing protein [Deltaproteobacteria bacterium]
MKYVIRDVEADGSAPVGGKARGLAALRPLGLSIPTWLALTSEAFYDSLTAAERDVLRAAQDAAAIRACVERARPDAQVQRELQQALAEMCPHGDPVAVRSSAMDEDGQKHSFAGLLESFLGVPPGEVIEKVAAVWRSGFSERVVAYRREQGLTRIPPAPAVLIQRMLQPDASGVAFGADPATGRTGVAIVAAVRGPGAQLVWGECEGETWQVEAGGRITCRRPPPKMGTGAGQHGADGEMLCQLPGASPHFQGGRLPPVLDDAQVLAVAELVWRTGEYRGVPQDIEWAIEGTCLHLLQARPITTLTLPGTRATGAGPRGADTATERRLRGAAPLIQQVRIWDNSNIGESYNGVTTPLTFSFARRAYEGVYRQFCRLLCVPDKVLARNDDIFPNMLGLIGGRVYYNLLNWYRALALLPGFSFNRRFMEQMMGVKEGLPEPVAARLTQAAWHERLGDGFRLAVSGCALVSHHFTLSARTRRFRRRLEEALGTGPRDLSRMSVDELGALYRDLERKLLSRWDAPLVNDFLAMIFFGVLRKTLDQWSPGAEEGLHNDLIGGEKEMISIEPAVRIREMARTALREPGLVRALGEDSLAGVSRAIEGAPKFREQFQAYLEKFGDRCLEELKLESLTLHDDPLMLARSVALMARRLEQPGNNEAVDRRSRAEERVAQALRWRPVRRLLFRWILRNTRARVRDRENLRFERTRLFARARQICLELGRRFHATGLLEDNRDVFYLEVQEILGFIEGTATCTDLRRLAALRKAEFDRYRRMPAPPGRFETRGPVSGDTGTCGKDPRMESTGATRRGLGCCPGIVRGRVRVVFEPQNATLQAGEILVAERTDPGWILLFPSAAGLIVERGSLLSHSAIVARELGIPAVISLPGVTGWLKDGDRVELDGGRGTVTRMDSRQEAAATGVVAGVGRWRCAEAGTDEPPGN